MTLSPLLKFALESFEEALEQYMKGTEKSRKFIILNCDQAIELILKDKLRDLGESIFKGSGRTIDYHEALDKLTNHKGVKIPEVADLELIHDERNIIQHKGATVSKEEAEFYIMKGYHFIKRFLKDELDIELKDHLDKRYYQLFEPIELHEFDREVERIKRDVEKIRKNAERKLIEAIDEKDKQASQMLLSAILLAYRELETEIVRLATALGFKAENIFTLSRDACQFLFDQGIISKPDMANFVWLTMIRNNYAHTDQIPSTQDTENFFRLTSELVNKIISRK